MTARMYYDRDADMTRLQNRPIAIIGFGSQGHAHALNLKDSGCDVRVGLPATSKSRAKAEAAGLRVLDVREAAREAQIVMLLVPDTMQAAVFENDLRDVITPGKTLMFAHGFNLHYGLIAA